MKDPTCDMLLAGLRCIDDVAPPIRNNLNLRRAIFTVDGLFHAGTPVQFVSVCNGLWNVQGPYGTRIFMVHPDEVAE